MQIQWQLFLTLYHKFILHKVTWKTGLRTLGQKIVNLATTPELRSSSKHFLIKPIREQGYYEINFNHSSATARIRILDLHFEGCWQGYRTWPLCQESFLTAKVQLRVFKRLKRFREKIFERFKSSMTKTIENHWLIDWDATKAVKQWCMQFNCKNFIALSKNRRWYLEQKKQGNILKRCGWTPTNGFEFAILAFFGRAQSSQSTFTVFLVTWCQCFGRFDFALYFLLDGNIKLWPKE